MQNVREQCCLIVSHQQKNNCFCPGHEWPCVTKAEPFQAWPGLTSRAPRPADFSLPKHSSISPRPHNGGPTPAAPSRAPLPLLVPYVPRASALCPGLPSLPVPPGLSRLRPGAQAPSLCFTVSIPCHQPRRLGAPD